MADREIKNNILTKPGYINGYEKKVVTLTNGSLLGMDDDAIEQLPFGMSNSLSLLKGQQEKKVADNERNKGEVMGDDMNNTQSMSDYTSHNFRYGMERTRDNEEFNKLKTPTTGLYWLDDPTLLAFSIKIDGDSPLFKTVDSETPSEGTLSGFLNDYNQISEISNRIYLHQEFVKKLGEIFVINPSPYGIDREPKGYYVNKIDGLDAFMKKMMKYKEDKLSVALQEDVTMRTFYLSELYNNLVYSYKNQRYIAPENLYRFNMTIEFSEYRNYILPIKDLENVFGPGAVDKYMENNNISDRRLAEEELYDLQQNKYSFMQSPSSRYQVTLYDCNFDFSTSKILSEHISQAGLGAPLPTEYSWLTFDIYYKSVRRKLIPDLINDSIILDNRSSFNQQEIIENINLESLRNSQKTPDSQKYNNVDIGFDPADKASLNSNYFDAAKAAKERSGKLQDFANSQRQGLMKQLSSDLLETINIERIGLSITDMVIGEQNRRLLLDGINGLRGEGNFELIRGTVSNFLTTEVNAIRRTALMELNSWIDDKIKGKGWEESILDGQGQLDDRNKLKLPIVDRAYDESEYDGGKPRTEIERTPDGAISYTESEYDGGKLRTEIERTPDGAISYEEEGPIYKPADGVAYDENSYEPKIPDGEVYVEPGPIYKPPTGSVYEEPDTPYKPPTGSVYEEPEPPYKPPTGSVYEEPEPPYKPPTGVVYDEPGPIYKPADGVVYEEPDTPYKPADGVVYEEPEQQPKTPDGDKVYEEPDYQTKTPDGVVYEEGFSQDKIPSGQVYDNIETPNKQPDGVVYNEDIQQAKTPDGDQLYNEEGQQLKTPNNERVYDDEFSQEKTPEGSVYGNVAPIDKTLKGESLFDEDVLKTKVELGRVYDNFAEFNTPENLGKSYEEGDEFKPKEDLGKVYNEDTIKNKPDELGRVYEKPDEENNDE